MASMFEPLLDALALGKTIKIPKGSCKIDSLKTSYYRYAKDNMFCAGKNLVVREDEENYIAKLERQEKQSKIEFTIIEDYEDDETAPDSSS